MNLQQMIKDNPNLWARAGNKYNDEKLKILEFQKLCIQEQIGHYQQKKVRISRRRRSRGLYMLGGELLRMLQNEHPTLRLSLTDVAAGKPVKSASDLQRYIPLIQKEGVREICYWDYVLMESGKKAKGAKSVKAKAGA